MKASITVCSMATLFALIASACTGGDAVLGAADANSDGASVIDAGADSQTLVPRAVSYAGNYIVPPASAVSTSAVDELHWIVSGERVALAYNLPRILVGGRIRVALAGTLDTTQSIATLTGPNGTARCDVDPASGALLRCDERFTDISADLARVRDVAMALDPKNVDARIDVAQRFSNEPIGVLEVGAVIPDGVTACSSAVSSCPTGTSCHLEAGDLGVCAAPDP